MKNSSVCLLFLLVFMLAACKKQLNALSTTITLDGNIIVDRESAQKVLNGVLLQICKRWNKRLRQQAKALAGQIFLNSCHQGYRDL